MVWVALGLLGADVCVAQTRGFALDRFEPAERGSDWFSAESLDLKGDGRFAVGGTFDYAHEPLVAYDENDDVAQRLVARQLFLHLGATYILAERVRFGLELPLLLNSAGDDVNTGRAQFSAPDGAALGDIRLGADVRLLGEYGEVFTLAAGAWVYLPNGSTDAFAGDGSTRIVPRLAAAGKVGLFEYAVKTGANWRTVKQNFANEPFGTEWQFGGAAGVRILDDKLLLGPEFWGSTVLSDSGAFDREGTPLELVLGGHFRQEDWVFGLGAGPGLTRGLGSPKYRVLLSIDFAPQAKAPPPPPPTPMDADDDGIVDEQDACPHEAGVATDDPTTNGCPPPPPDTDEDGIEDSKDACPEVAGVAHDDPKRHGCPPDRDEDGIIDEQDACPDEAGVANDDPTKHGCPVPPDSDGDGIIDEQDACPDVPGPARSPASKNGCPLAKVTATKVEILERIEFDTGKATIRPESDEVLQAVYQILQAHPEITKVSVEGHTDNVGANWLNRKLSGQRAQAVVEWLTDQGIEPERLTSKGFGPDRPIDSNSTEEGRQNNRRVEFQIVERTAKPAAEDHSDETGEPGSAE